VAAGQPLAVQQHLLLVAAGQATGRHADIRSTDAQGSECLVGAIACLVAVEDSAALRVATQHGEIDVVEARHVEEQAERLPVLGEVGNARRERLAGCANVDLVSVNFNMAQSLGRGADDQMGKLGAAGADQPGETNHLAGMHGQRATLDAWSVGEVDGRKYGSATRRIRISFWIVLLLVEGGEHRARPSGGRWCSARDLGLVERADEVAVAQHADAVGEFVDLAHAVADVDDGDAFRLQLPDDGEQPLGLVGRQRGGRLVHDRGCFERACSARAISTSWRSAHRQAGDQRRGRERSAPRRSRIGATAVSIASRASRPFRETSRPRIDVLVRR
jgi:hypothetical protein